MTLDEKRKRLAEIQQTIRALYTEQYELEQALLEDASPFKRGDIIRYRGKYLGKVLSFQRAGNGWVIQKINKGLTNGRQTVVYDWHNPELYPPF